MIYNMYLIRYKSTRNKCNIFQFFIFYDGVIARACITKSLNVLTKAVMFLNDVQKDDFFFNRFSYFVVTQKISIAGT